MVTVHYVSWTELLLNLLMWLVGSLPFSVPIVAILIMVWEDKERSKLQKAMIIVPTLVSILLVLMAVVDQLNRPLVEADAVISSQLQVASIESK